MSDIVRHDGRASEQEMFAQLRQPFTSEVIMWKIQTNPRENDTFALCVAYIDARDVAARLNEVVGIDWETSFGDIICFSGSKKEEWGVPCRLTVMGHTRTDIGKLPATEPLKGGYSDALKRAAVQFGIAAYVYAFPEVKAEVQKFGSSYYFTANAKKELAQLVQIIHSGVERLPKFHAIKVRDYAPIRFDSPYFGGESESKSVDEREQIQLTSCEAEGCQNAIADYTNEQGKTISAAKIAEGTRAKYGLALCWDCAQKAKAEAEKVAQEAESHGKATPKKRANPAKVEALDENAKASAKRALEDARKRYEEASVIGKMLAIPDGYNQDYLKWNAATLDQAIDKLGAAIRQSISSAALQDDAFLDDERGEGLPGEEESLDDWFTFAAAWELVDTIRTNNQARNLNKAFDLNGLTAEEVLEEIPH